MTTKRKTFCDLPVSGRRVEIQAVPGWLIDAAQQSALEEFVEKIGALPEPPSYEVETPAGRVRKTHTAQTVRTNEEKADWLKYVDGQFLLTTLTGGRIIDVALSQGIVGIEPTPEWEGRMKVLRVKMPEGAEEKRLAFIKCEITNSPEDTEAVARAVLKLSGIDADLISRAKNDFRVMLSKSNRGVN